jgi:hypothetical protein
MKENETVNSQELETINSELFHSFDPEEASWVIGGVSKRGTASATASPGEPPDFEADFEVDF